MKIRIPSFTRNANIRRSTKKIGLVCLFLSAFGGYVGMPATNSFFSDQAEIAGASVSAGVWIPELTITVSPGEPDGKDGWYKTEPCVGLETTLDAKIFYTLGDGEKEYGDGCVKIPDGEWTFSAYAENDGNGNWRSPVVSRNFKVGYEEDEAEEGDVVINELMWMGSDGNSDDEWIELRNMTDEDIDISNWRIENGGSGSGHLQIPNGYSIEAEGYFLILKEKWDETAIDLDEDLGKDEGMTNVSSMDLKNTGEKLVLENKQGDVIDTAWKNRAWPAGENGDKKKSMERNDTPGDGTDGSDWHTCEDTSCNDVEFWKDADGKNYGTPLAENRSENDPTSDDQVEQDKQDQESETPAQEPVQETDSPILPDQDSAIDTAPIDDQTPEEDGLGTETDADIDASDEAAEPEENGSETDADDDAADENAKLEEDSENDGEDESDDNDDDDEEEASGADDEGRESDEESDSPAESSQVTE